jgi:CRISPR-associated exonuclease Cas4
MDFTVTGTLVWYYCICQREVWLMARHLTPEQDDKNIDLGRYIHENAYERDKKEIDLGHIKIDLMRNENGELVVGEVKKSSKFINSARMQLLFYLSELKKIGIEARGELMFPTEKKKEEVLLDEAGEEEVARIVKEIQAIAIRDQAPLPAKIKYCRNCGYQEFCWA